MTAALRNLSRVTIRHAGWVLAAALVLSALSLSAARHLRIDTELSNLIPAHFPSVRALERLRDTVGGDSEVAVAIESPSFEANRSFAEALIPPLLDLRRPSTGERYFSHCEYRRDSRFLEENALYFATDEEIDQVADFVADALDEARAQASPLYVGLGDDATYREAEAEDLRRVYRSLVASEYPVSADSTTLVIRLYPATSATDLGIVAETYRAVDSTALALHPTAYHAGMTVTSAGRLLRRLTEVSTVTRDVTRSLGAGVAAVLLVVVVYFSYKSLRARAGGGLTPTLLLTTLTRAPVMAGLIGLPFLMSLSWTFAVAYLVYGQLNLMTSTLGLVLFGLGIDYGIHFYARYTEERGRGHSVEAAAAVTFTGTGQAIALGAFTTAGSLLVLTAGSFRGFSHFGLLAGIGILFALAAMTLVMPALVALCERAGLLCFDVLAAVAAPAAAPGRRFPLARGLVLVGLGSVALAVALLPEVEFEYRFGELEPEFTEYNRKREKIRRVYPPSARRNPAYVVTDSPEEVLEVAAAVRRNAAADTLSPTIGAVVTIQDRYPMSPAAAVDKLGRIAAIRQQLEHPLLAASTSDDLARLRRAAQTRRAIALDEIPKSLRGPFQAKSGAVGRFLRIYPSVGLSDGRNSIAFAEDVGRISTDRGKVYHAGSPTIVAADVLRLVQRESPWMVGATFVLVAVLMWVVFGSARWAALALMPLIVGVLWMLLAMQLLHIRLNLYNMVVLPAVLGMGNDAGAHLVHRYREEGRGSLFQVLRSTGEHITVGSLTTVIGFCGPLLSLHPGLRTIGVLAITGLGATWLAAIAFAPALLQWLEDAEA